MSQEQTHDRLPKDLWEMIHGFSSREPRLPPRTWKQIEGYVGPRTEMEVLTRRALKRRSCSPCNVLLSDFALESEDEPYDTIECDPECVGRWGTALGRLAEAVCQAAEHYGYAREINFRLQLDNADYLLIYRARPGQRTVRLGSLQLLEEGRFVRGRIISRAKDGLIWGDLVFLNVNRNHVGNVWPRQIAVPLYSLTLTRSRRPTTKQGTDAVAVPFSRSADSEQQVDVGYNFEATHVRIFSRKNTGMGIEKFRDPKSGDTWVYNQRRDWLREAFWENAPERRQLV